MPKDQPQNLRRVEESLDGNEIAAFNKISPGLGSKLHKLFTNLGQQHAAQAGHKGTVAIAPQEGKDSTGKLDLAMDFQGGRAGGAADAIDDTDLVTLRQVRRLIPEAEGDNAAAPFSPSDVCKPIALSNLLKATTGMTAIYAAEMGNEFIYLAGEDDGTPLFEVYRLIIGDNNMIKVGTLTQAEIIKCMVWQGHFCFGCSDSGASSNLTIIDVQKPDAPVELASSPFNVGAVAYGLDVEGRYVAVAVDSAVKVVDMGVPGVPQVVGSAS